MLTTIPSQTSGLPQDVIFQQDSDPPHFAFIVRYYLDKKPKAVGFVGALQSHRNHNLQT